MGCGASAQEKYLEQQKLLETIEGHLIRVFTNQSDFDFSVVAPNRPHDTFTSAIGGHGGGHGGGGGGAGGSSVLHRFHTVLEFGNDFLETEWEIIRVVRERPCGRQVLIRRKSDSQLVLLDVVRKVVALRDWKGQFGDRMNHLKHFINKVQHPYLLRCHFTVETKNFFLLGMEPCLGPSLSELIVLEGGHISERRLRQYMAEICLVLESLHEKSVIYRDLNLDNILIDTDGHVRILPSWNSVRLSKTKKKRSSLTSIEGFRPPEMIQGKMYGFCVDWWCYGLVMYMCLNGKHPYSGGFGSLDAKVHKGGKRIDFKRGVSKDAASLCLELLKKEPRTRLGGGSRHGAVEIQTHSFFTCVNWLLVKTFQQDPKWTPEEIEVFEEPKVGGVCV